MNECELAAIWVEENAEKEFGEKAAKMMIIGGESAGVTCRRVVLLREAGDSVAGTEGRVVQRRVGHAPRRGGLAGHRDRRETRRWVRAQDALEAGQSKCTGYTT